MTAVESPPLPDLLAASLEEVEGLLDSVLRDLRRQWRGDSPHADPVLGASDVPDLLGDLVRAGGKRLRPTFLHCGWAASGGVDREPVVRLGAALELLHVFGLVQDDVMDRSATRRGGPTVHVRAGRLHRAAAGDPGPDDASARYGDSIAVLVGDLAHAEADALVAGLPAPVAERWRALMRELVRGQARDLSLAARRTAGGAALALDQAWEVARTKSGAYTVQRPLELGAVLAGADEPVLERLSTAGRLLGEAFALRDDLLGVWGDPARTGKPVGDDLRQAKPTVLVALGEQRLVGAERDALRRLARQRAEDSDVDLVTSAMEARGIRADLEAMVRRRRDEAVGLLDSPHLDAAGVAALVAVADTIVEGAS